MTFKKEIIKCKKYILPIFLIKRYQYFKRNEEAIMYKTMYQIVFTDTIFLLALCVICVLFCCNMMADERKIEPPDPFMLDATEEERIQAKITYIAACLGITEGSATIKPKGFRPMFVVEDFADLPDGWKAGEMTIVKRNEATKSYETIVFPNETVKNYGMNIMKLATLATNDKKVIAEGGIGITHAQNQKEVYREIFQGIMSTSMPIDMVVKKYRMPDDLKLGELCLSYGFEKNRDNVTIRRGVTFARDASAFSVSSITDDVSSLAKYLDAKYDALTKELNSPPAFRKWIMLDGIFLVEGKYVSSDLVKVVLVDKDGKQLEIELSKLSPTDKLYTKRRYEINKATEKNNKNTNPQKSK
jgi:hypothetical protein